MSFIMQAKSSTSGALITWQSTDPDWVGDFFPGPGSPLDVAIMSSSAAGGGDGGIAIAPYDRVITQADWYITPSSGSDSAIGDVDNPLATWAGLMKRWGSCLLAPAGGVLTVHLMENLPITTDPVFEPSRMRIANNAIVVVRGSGTVLRTGTITAVTPGNRTSVPALAWSIEDTGMGGTSWTADLGRRARITSGPNAGVTFGIAKDLGANTARISWPIDSSTPGGAVTKGVVQVGDTYVIESLIECTIGEVSPTGDTSQGTGRFPTAVFFDLRVKPSDILGPRFTVVDSNCNVFFYRCVLDTEITAGRASNDQGTYFGNCIFTSDFITCSGIMAIYGGLALGPEITTQGAAFLYLDGDLLCQGTRIEPGGGVFIGALAIFDSTSNGIDVCAGYSYFMRSLYDVDSALYGAGNAGVGVRVGERGSLLCTNVTPNITGVGGDFALGAGPVRGWADKVSDYTQPRTATWANFDADIGDGGFSRGAHNIAEKSAILRTTNLGLNSDVLVIGALKRAERFPVADGETRSLRFIVTVKSTDGSGAVMGEWEVKAAYTRIGGVLAQAYAPSIIPSFTVGAPPVPTLTLNGNTDVDLNVDGTGLTWTVAAFRS